jgi:CRP-like cAMP-binding protein
MIPFEFPFEKFKFGSDSVLEGLSNEDNSILNRNKVTHKYRRGEILFREGSYPTGIYFVKKGKIKKYTTDKDGHEQIIYVYQPGELLGYHALISQEYFRDSARVMEEAVISFIPKEDFLLALNSSPALSNRLLKCLSHEFGVMAHFISIFAHKTAKERIAFRLLMLRDKYKKDGSKGKPTEINLTREDLANLAGTTRETLTRLLQEFKQAGLIEINGRRIILKKPKELSQIANLY